MTSMTTRWRSSDPSPWCGWQRSVPMSSPTWFRSPASSTGSSSGSAGERASCGRARSATSSRAGDGSRLVFDDLPSFDPFIARSLRVYGAADDPVERVGISGPGWYVRIVPTESWSWNLEGEPVGEEWYAARHRIYRQ